MASFEAVDSTVLADDGVISSEMPTHASLKRNYHAKASWHHYHDTTRGSAMVLKGKKGTSRSVLACFRSARQGFPLEEHDFVLDELLDGSSGWLSGYLPVTDALGIGCWGDGFTL